MNWARALLLLLSFWTAFARADAAPDDEETRLWQRVEGENATPGAWLDLAVHYCESGRPLVAERIFRLVEEHYAPPAAVRDLIAELRRSGCNQSSPRPVAQDIVSVRLFAGRDSNPNQGLSTDSLTLYLGGAPVQLALAPQNRPREDGWRAMEVGWMRGGEGWRPFVFASLRRYDSERDFDTNHLVAGFVTLDGEGSETHFDATAFTLGDRLYRTEIQAYWLTPVPGAAALSWGGGGGVQHYPLYPEQDDVQVEPRLVWRFLAGEAVRGRLATSVLLDVPTRGRPGGTRTSFIVQGEGRALLPLPSWYLDARFRYEHVREREAYSPLFGDVKRRGDDRLGEITLGYVISRASTLSLMVQHQRADDDIPLFAYTRRQTALVFEHLFR